MNSQHRPSTCEGGARKWYRTWFAPLAAIAAALAPTPSHAQTTYYWNGANAAASPANGGTGTWNTSTANWRQPTDTGSAVTWPGTTTGADRAIFAGTSGTVTLSGSLAANRLSFSVGGYTLTGGTLGLDGAAPALSVTTGTATISSVITVTGGVTKTGAGTLVLSASNGAGFAGGATISAGILQLNSAFAVGNGTITLGDATTGASDVQLTISSGVDRSGTFTNAITVASQGTGKATLKFNEAVNGGNTGNGTITLNRATTFDATGFATGSSFYQFNHPLSGTGAMTLTNSNGNRFILLGASSTYTGDITVQSGGIFEPRNSLSATTGNNVTIEAGGELRIQFAIASIGALLGSGTVQSVTAGNTLTVGKGGASGTFSGIIRDAPTVVALTKSSSGTQTLTGANTYTGLTTISGGVLQIGNGGATGSLSGSSAIAGSAGATLAFNRSNTVTQGIDFNNVIGGSINVRQIGAGTLLLSASNTYTGTTTAAAGTIIATGTGSLPGYATANRVVFDGGTLAVRPGGSGWTTGQVDSLLAAATKTAGALGIDTTNGNVTQWTAFTTTNFGPNLGLAKLGPGSLTLSSSNTYAGATSISSGTLVVGNGATAGSIGSTAGVNVASGAALTFNRSDDYGGTFTRIISGSGDLRVLAGRLLMGAASSYSGGTFIDGGTLEIGSGGSIANTSGVTVAAGSTFLYNAGTTLTVAPVLQGAGTGSRAVLGGSGRIDAAMVLDNLGDTLSPGNSPGITTWGTSQNWSSFTYQWETNDFTGLVAGTAFDQIQILGGLTLSGSAGSYSLDILSLTAGNVSGLVPNFSEISREWTIITTTGGITGFDANDWTVNPSGFTPVGQGTWSVKQSQSGNDLVLVYAAVPEPSGMILAAIGVAAASWRMRRRSRP